MLRLLTRPRWLLRHALVIGLCVAFFFLSRWQYHRGEESEGTVQNYGYSIEWLLFGGCVCFGWWKMLQDELHPQARGQKVRRASPWRPPEPRTAEQATTAEPTTTGTGTGTGTTTGTTGTGTTGTPAAPPAVPVEEPVAALLGPLAEDRGGFPAPLTTAEIDPDDEEVVRYNAWLAQLSRAPVEGYRPKARR